MDIIHLYKQRLREKGHPLEGDTVKTSSGIVGVLEIVKDTGMGGCQPGFTVYKVRDRFGKLHEVTTRPTKI